MSIASASRFPFPSTPQTRTALRADYPAHGQALLDVPRCRARMFAAADGVRDPDMTALARASGVAEIAGDFSVYAGGEEMRPRALRLADAQINGLAMG